jgi:hypothetical protein
MTLPPCSYNEEGTSAEAETNGKVKEGERETRKDIYVEEKIV